LSPATSVCSLTADVVHCKPSWSRRTIRVIAWSDGDTLFVKYHPHDCAGGDIQLSHPKGFVVLAPLPTA
jgi:hypothetical protein